MGKYLSSLVKLFARMHQEMRNCHLGKLAGAIVAGSHSESVWLRLRPFTVTGSLIGRDTLSVCVKLMCVGIHKKIKSHLRLPYLSFYFPGAQWHSQCSRYVQLTRSPLLLFWSRPQRADLLCIPHQRDSPSEHLKGMDDGAAELRQTCLDDFGIDRAKFGMPIQG